MTGPSCPPAELPMDAIRAHAQRLAASLPPFTQDEARAAGRMAAALDAKRQQP